MKIAGFDWDEGNWPKCGKHGLSRKQIEAALAADPLVMLDRSSADEDRYNAVAQLEGRYVFAVFTYRQSETGTLIRPISARYMHDKEVRRYERDRPDEG